MTKCARKHTNQVTFSKMNAPGLAARLVKRPVEVQRHDCLNSHLPVLGKAECTVTKRWVVVHCLAWSNHHAPSVEHLGHRQPESEAQQECAESVLWHRAASVTYGIGVALWSTHQIDMPLVEKHHLWSVTQREVTCWPRGQTNCYRNQMRGLRQERVTDWWQEVTISPVLLMESRPKC